MSQQQQPELPIDPQPPNEKAGIAQEYRAKCFEQMLIAVGNVRVWLHKFPIDDKHDDGMMDQLQLLCDDMRGSILEWSRSP